jgi:hypothetical protein
VHFIGELPLKRPADPKLFDAVVKYVAENMVGKVNLFGFAGLWTAVEVVAGEYKIHGVYGCVNRPDFILWRSTGKDTRKATAKIVDYLNNHFVQAGMMGCEVLVEFHAEPEELRCPRADESLKAVDARPAHRWAITVK